MKDIVTTIKGYVNDLIQLSLSLIAFGAVMGILFPGGMFGMDVIGNLIALVNKFGEAGFAGFITLVVLVGLFRK
tara:strand:+ start:383 stop:604 length:222 start_codon:yes stop_codon:yes gene_type:complete